MKEQLEQQVLHSICLKKGSFEWVDKGKDIKTNGKMFDVKTSHEEAGPFYFIGLIDKKRMILRKK